MTGHEQLELSILLRLYKYVSFVHLFSFNDFLIGRFPSMLFLDLFSEFISLFFAHTILLLFWIRSFVLLF